ncbi:unnamed protein product [Pleuronectes platessa]|uniref:Uncharacterized protein n=1 Tax=Pleuronectes platessa TaxID=8262 RepID=A0A9N7UG61_PLEPL|nr:unnamed protein product [Pleuronectes platessa]
MELGVYYRFEWSATFHTEGKSQKQFKHYHVSDLTALFPSLQVQVSTTEGDYSCQENSTCDGPYYDIGATGTCAEEGGGGGRVRRRRRRRRRRRGRNKTTPLK